MKSPWLYHTQKGTKVRCPLKVEGKRCLLKEGHKEKCFNPLLLGDGEPIVFPKISWMEMKLIDMKTPQKMIDVLVDALYITRKGFKNVI